MSSSEGGARVAAPQEVKLPPELIQAHQIDEVLRRDYEGGVVANAQLPVVCFENFATDKEIELLHGAVAGRFERSLVMGQDKDRLVMSEVRTSSSTWVPYDYNKGVLGLAQRISDLVGIPLERAEPFQVVSYGPNQQYQPHYDVFRHGHMTDEKAMENGGQRLVTAILYMNDVYEGGETVFPKLGFKVPAKKARLAVFHNCLPGTNLGNPLSLHGGLPVPKGAEPKYLANLWFRERTFEITPEMDGRMRPEVI